MDPPPCIQNAMMTKDKKPFTYTPGGIDLSEVRSPRMQRRIERNANLEGVSDVPKPPPSQNVGPLPPSALAAMRPQTQVQVFPAPPPPPPMNKNIPPPPPPPSCPLPTQKVSTNEGVLERPDMTKIIPENPMALLRKTGGPAPRKSLVDQMYIEDKNAPTPPSPPQRSFEAQSPRYPNDVIERTGPASPPIQRQPQSYQPPTQQYQTSTQPQNQYQPPQNQYQPQQQTYQPPQYQSSQNQYQPQNQYQQSQNQYPSTQNQYQSQQRSVSPKPTYIPPLIERQSTIPRQEPPQKTVSSSVGSLYIPPLNQQQKIVSPPTPPERQVQSPGTPTTLKEAPKPWTQKTVQQQPELPPWAKREDEERIQPSYSPPSTTQPQQRWQQPPRTAPAPQPVQQPVRQPPNQQYQSRPQPQSHQPQRSPGVQNPSSPSNSFPVHIEIRAVPYPQEPPEEERNPNAVYVTQPIVLQHPGPRVQPPYQGQPKLQQPQQQQQQVNQNYSRQSRPQEPKVDSQGARIIPIHIEGRTPPTTPGAERSLNRQLSWGSQPTQSNTFKVIQRITRTDDDEDDDTPITHHSPRYPQEMTEQLIKMKINDNGQFKRGPQQGGGGRTGPVQMEGNGHSQPYVHPSEQVVPEPKKYMGSNIPSRSFKILQAMTAPENCANANHNEDLTYNSPYNPYSYPFYPNPYWNDYYSNYYPKEHLEPSKSNEKFNKNDRSTPIHSGTTTPLPMPFMPPPYWPDYYPNYYPQQSESVSKMSDKSSTRSGRSTPIPNMTPMPPPIPPPVPPPYWGYMHPNFARSPQGSPKSENNVRPKTPKPNREYQYSSPEDPVQYPPYPMFPNYYDPYYYSYYYGYPPIIPPYPYRQQTTDTEELSGYSSMDEMSSYNNRKPSHKRRNSLDNTSTGNSVQALRRQFEVRSKSAVPRISITPTCSQEKPAFFQEGRELDVPPDKDQDFKDSEEEAENSPTPEPNKLCRLQSIKSVPNIQVYANEGTTTDTSESEESSEEEIEEEEILVVQEETEVIPDQLSVIYEESERGESRRSCRPSSVASESRTIEEYRSEDEEELDDFLSSQNVEYKINLFQETCEQLRIKSHNGKVTSTFKEECEEHADITIKGPFSRKTNKGKEIKNKEQEQTNSKLIQNPDTDISIIRPVDDNDIKSRKTLSKQNEEHQNNKNEKDVEKCPIDLVHENDISNQKQITNGDSSNVRWNETIKYVLSENKDSSIINDKINCDTINSKSEYVMIEVGEEVVCVKLRNKSGRSRKSHEVSKEEITSDSSDHRLSTETITDSFFSAHSSSNRNSVYDILKDDEEHIIPLTGTLMKVDSFCSKLEEIKKQSGLWNFNIDFEKFPDTIKEECKENELPETLKNDNTTVDSDISSDLDSHFDMHIKDQNDQDSPCISKENLLDEENNPNTEEQEEIQEEENCNQSDGSDGIDFWSQIKGEDDEYIPRRRSQYYEYEGEIVLEHESPTNSLSNTGGKVCNSDSSSSRDSSLCKSQELGDCNEIQEENISSPYSYGCNNQSSNKHTDHKEIEHNSESESSESSDESSEEEQEQLATYINNSESDRNRKSSSRSRSLEPNAIKERIEALRNSIAEKQKKLQDKQEEEEPKPAAVRNKIAAIELSVESRSKTASTKSSVRSFEEYSEEEEGDSGVISDVSRHISDNEEFPELKKLTRYERAATHSRLFKLLQDECDLEEEDEVFEKQNEDKFSRLSVRQNSTENRISPNRSKLSLPLNKFNETRENYKPQINEKLVEELVQSFLRSKKAQMFRNIPKSKLHAAAIKILQEGADSEDTPSDLSSFLSPLKGETETSTPAQTPQEFYDIGEYKQYYDSWGDDTTEILPTKAFKLLQEHIGTNRLGSIEGILSKCPKILSSNNIPKEIQKLLGENSSNIPSFQSHNPPPSNDETNT